MAVVWDIALCSLVDINQCFRGAYCPHHHLYGSILYVMFADSKSFILKTHHQMMEALSAPMKCQSVGTRLHSATSQRTAIFVLATVRTSNVKKIE
jgi:hypothetical protein